MRRYQGEVKCTKSGSPVCCLDEELCDVEECRYYAEFLEIGNCVLRVRREFTYEEIGIALGVSKQRAEQLVTALLPKVRARFVGE